MVDKQYYMACLDIEGRSCLVVGGGRVGIEKASGLLDCGARVTVVAPQADPELLDLPVEWIRRS
jgi:siroheme synthase (precorrin-2 oxidase/ferrochelatase)